MLTLKQEIRFCEALIECHGYCDNASERTGLVHHNCKICPVDHSDTCPQDKAVKRAQSFLDNIQDEDNQI